ncbi:MAG: hypothetical protein A2849_00630 [Candidatus Taylorbacteria bacterium RIFCSPHIGHO2_01_FULL_51_15]|uniref:Carboxypeptidase regulatory-like domain-containing protein n=1 Tax=Candidatus Taylorbacteria bacterium RIFCSPHIGHO2_01_FULL_51_15 TaxID=1802304 RepID=A0A1G2M9F9_9BACT|nr:MAG: hypothetical protein A2849_00630 [Candidatus Taylorbacteria bacterium RIFCSPHIGHO2_01_FULL_51_15]
MERTPKLIAGISIAVVILTSLGIYAYLQSREYLRGPVLTISEPLNGATSTTSLVTLRGTSKNISFLTLNGRQIFTDEQGRFEESLLLEEGYSIMTLEAKDRFGHTEIKRLELVYKPMENQNGNSKMENGTTTAPQF